MSRHPFVMGWHHGRRYRTDNSPREIMERFPEKPREWINSYLCGQDDGIVCDRWRLNRILADRLVNAYNPIDQRWYVLDSHNGGRIVRVLADYEIKLWRTSDIRRAYGKTAAPLHFPVDAGISRD